MEVFIYIVLVILTLVSCLFGFFNEIMHGNIGHIKNGREPNAGAAIFPSIPFVQITYVFVAWRLNELSQNIGFYAVLLYFLFSMAMKIHLYKKLKLELSVLNDKNS